MSDVMNSIFGRSKNDIPNTREADATEAIEVDQTETVEPAGAATETAEETDFVTEEVADSSPETASAEETADSDQAEEDAGPTADVPDAEAAEADGEITAVAEPVTAETRPAAGVRGSTTMGDGVVPKIVTMVARKVEGVHALDDEGVSVEIDSEIVLIKISLVVVFGHKVKTLAEQLRIKVIEAVEDFLGLDVIAVDVHVLDIHLPDAD